MRDLRGLLAIMLVCGVSQMTFGKEPPFRVFCPAVRQDDTDEGYADVPEDILPVAMTVVGTLDPETMNLKIERTLFGPRIPELTITPGKHRTRDSWQSGPRIYCLSLARKEWRPDPEKTGVRRRTQTADPRFTISEFFEGKRIFPLEKEPALAALAQARLDLLVLGTPTILVGRPVDAPDQRDQPAAATVEQTEKRPTADPLLVSIHVERVLYGDPSQAGQTVQVEGYFDPIPSPTGAYLYFVSQTHRSTRGTRHQVFHRWPDAEVPLVEASLKRRELFPVRDGLQEIGFTGTVREAIVLMGIHHEAGESLAARRLISDCAAALPEVTAFIESHLFRETSGELLTYGQQTNLIRVLGLMEEHRDDGEIVRLIHLMLDRIQAGAAYPHPPQKERKKDRRATRYLATDANHSLLWLLLTLEEPTAARLFGQRLLELRGLAAYGWREEIQEYLDRGHLEDQLELSAVRERMTTIQPVRWSAAADKDDAPARGHSTPISQIEFVDGGARVRTVSADGVACVWEPQTGGQLNRTVGHKPPDPQKSPPRIAASGREFTFEETESRSEDARTSYLFKVTDTGGKYGPPRAFSVAVRDASKPDPAKNANRDAAGAAATWRLLGEVDLKWGQHEPFGLVPDGKHLHFATQIFRREDLAFVSAANVTGRVYDFQFVPDGARYLISTSENVTHRGSLPGVTVRRPVLIRIRVHDTKTGRTLLAVELRDGTGDQIAISPDGRFLAIVEKENAVCVWPVPEI